MRSLLLVYRVQNVERVNSALDCRTLILRVRNKKLVSFIRLDSQIIIVNLCFAMWRRRTFFVQVYEYQLVYRQDRFTCDLITNLATHGE